jgi:RNA polymerase sigma-70 factor (ECF subfamily)
MISAEPAGAMLSDRSLLRRLREGSDNAATQLYLRYARRLAALAANQCSHDLARHVDAEDIVQSVFSSFFRGVNQGYYDVPAGEELWKLLLVIALNKIRAKGNYLRAARRDLRRTTGEGTLPGGLGEQAGPDEAAHTFFQLVLDETLATLPPPQRDMIVLRIEGHEVAEIAARTGRSKRTVERVLQEFRQKLSTVLDAER